jgi:hypothetical protein
MRFLAIHDRHGKIWGLVSGPDDGPPAMLEVDIPWLESSEVDLSDTPLAASAFESEEGAMKALDAYRIDVKREAKPVRHRKKRDKK